MEKKNYIAIAALFFIVLIASPCQAWAKKTRQVKNRLGMSFVLVSHGSFMMGSPADEQGRYDREIRHKVTITRDFYVQTTEVTQAQWEQVMGTRPWSGKKNVREGANYPAVYVSWKDCNEFVKKLNRMEHRNAYRLPTEAQWEYACRAGSDTRFCFGNDETLLPKWAWFKKNCKERNEPFPHETATLRPNTYGIYDMHGNVWEWCSDWYGVPEAKPAIDPLGPSSGMGHVLKGGGFYFAARDCRSANRFFNLPGFRDFVLGFRIIRTK